ncbi:unnamed protein product [Gongylonema pulchrum]|uniref:Protein kinase domain-containing protein n=1 Tax=Gongylonema pulchrum TaxID=637853 RepID=A0A183DT56_9BILA|nr:unnamed protein product [Gongylonema pulchrum]
MHSKRYCWMWSSKNPFLNARRVDGSLPMAMIEQELISKAIHKVMTEKGQEKLQQQSVKPNEEQADSFSQRVKIKLESKEKTEQNIVKIDDKGPKLRIDQSRLAGEFYNRDDNGDWRVIGMRPTRTNLASIEYDVIRHCNVNVSPNCAPLTTQIAKALMFQVMTMEKNDHIMKLSNSDNSRDHVLFMQQYKLLLLLKRRFQNYRQRKYFPATLGCGAFKELCYRERPEEGERSAKLFIYFPNPNPRPYFLQEKIEPTLEEMLRMTQFGVLDIGTARDFIIGCIKALRLVHRVGYVHRCVAPYNFAIRLATFSKMKDLCDQICVIDLTLARKYKDVNKPPRRVATFAGTYKYCSLSAHKYMEQFPKDDIISCLYMFCEFLHGSLPWRGLKDLKKIMKLKQELQLKPPVLMDSAGQSDAVVTLNELPGMFKLLEENKP